MGLPGKQRTLGKLVDDHYQSMYRYAYRLSGSAADAEDLTQEAFCKAQTYWTQLRDQERAKPWLFSILRNAHLHRVRAAKQERCVALDNACDVADSPSFSPSEPLAEIDPEKLQQALVELPEVFRTPIILYYFEDFSYRDIAEQMDLPLGTVMSRLARAKVHLRSRLQEPTPATLDSAPRRANDGL